MVQLIAKTYSDYSLAVTLCPSYLGLVAQQTVGGWNALEVLLVAGEEPKVAAAHRHSGDFE